MYELDINLSESLCGFDHKIRHIDGKKIHIRHKEAIVNGEYLVYKGKGMPIPKSNLMGDLFIKLKVEKPQISKKQRNKIYNILNDTKEDAPHIDKPSKNIVTFEDFESEQLAKSSS
jgi:DnaJ-class molecular chaperone